MLRHYSKTLILVLIPIFLFAGDFAIEVLAPDVGELIKKEPMLKRPLWGLVLFCLATAVFTFVREHSAPVRAAEEEKDATESDYLNRRILLSQVRRNWVDGVLHKSLWREVRLILNLEGKPNAVVRPCDLALRRVGQPETYIPPETSIFDVYKEEQEELLLLGEPGSGKTTLLLEIIERLLPEAEDNPKLPIPVIFNLSSWRKNHARLNEWMVEQLNQDYGIPEKTGRRWVERGELLLLLDGLDEVVADRRAACLEAINIYRMKHQTVLRPMVVCCRTREYDELPKLRLTGAVVIQSLTKQQVDGYLKVGGKALAGLRAVLRDEPTFYQELFATPLMLHVAVMTYEGKSATELRRTATPEERRRRLWDAYIEQMFVRKQEIEAQYDTAIAVDWLAWLGSYLRHNHLQKYLIEGMQPNDLPKGWQAAVVRWLLLLLMTAITWPLFLASIFWRQSSPTYEHSDVPSLSEPMIFIILAIGLLFSIWMWVHIWYTPTIELQPVRRFTVRRLRDQWKSLLVRMAKKAGSGAAGGAGGGAILGAIGAILVAVDHLIWPRLGTKFQILDWVLAIPLTASVYAVIFGLLGAAGGGVSQAGRELFDVRLPENTIQPNEGILRSIRTAAGTILICLFSVGTLMGFLLGGTITSRWRALKVGIATTLLGAFVSFFVAPFFGARAGFQHYLLRVLLWRSGRFPLNIVRFLDWAAQRVLVQRVGGGWQFVHRTLQERFAERYDEKYAG
ncbi:MAG TPA: NACHT domain-containing protein [Pyrinomonadaceae bacterium]|nr:NACHT domain-containing protein [Pyrinomonadaceae bacterium]